MAKKQFQVSSDGIVARLVSKSDTEMMFLSYLPNDIFEHLAMPGLYNIRVVRRGGIPVRIARKCRFFNAEYAATGADICDQLLHKVGIKPAELPTTIRVKIDRTKKRR